MDVLENTMNEDCTQLPSIFAAFAAKTSLLFLHAGKLIICNSALKCDNLFQVQKSTLTSNFELCMLAIYVSSR